VPPTEVLADPIQRRLVEEVLRSVHESLARSAEPSMEDLPIWLIKALRSGLMDWTVPSGWVKRFGMDQPLALYWLKCDEVISGTLLRSLLQSYFDQHRLVQMIELDDQEWLIFLAFGRSGKVVEQQGQTLEHAEGLHELLIVEMATEVQVLAERPRRWFRGSTDEPEWEASPLLQMVQQLRQIGKWAREWMPEHLVHGLWMFQLEQLMLQLPIGMRQQWLSSLGGWGKWYPFFSEQPELERTLLTWIQSDANISESSKMLFIHRNTLLYRLDKIHQEIGLDPRKINDLILLRIGYSLYKMHKKT
jgi:hypothetical protein